MTSISCSCSRTRVTSSWRSRNATAVVAIRTALAIGPLLRCSSGTSIYSLLYFVNGWEATNTIDDDASEAEAEDVKLILCLSTIFAFRHLLKGFLLSRMPPLMSVQWNVYAAIFFATSKSGPPLSLWMAPSVLEGVQLYGPEQTTIAAFCNTVSFHKKRLAAFLSCLFVNSKILSRSVIKTRFSRHILALVLFVSGCSCISAGSNWSSVTVVTPCPDRYSACPLFEPGRYSIVNSYSDVKFNWSLWPCCAFFLVETAHIT